jgi:hypothetical protein
MFSYASDLGMSVLNFQKKLSSVLFWDIMPCCAVITTQHGIISQKSADLINIAAEA